MRNETYFCRLDYGVHQNCPVVLVSHGIRGHESYHIPTGYVRELDIDLEMGEWRGVRDNGQTFDCDSFIDAVRFVYSGKVR